MSGLTWSRIRNDGAFPDSVKKLSAAGAEMGDDKRCATAGVSQGWCRRMTSVVSSLLEKPLGNGNSI